MLKSTVTEEKKLKYSPWAGADNPLGPIFYVNRKASSLWSFVASLKRISSTSNTHLFMFLVWFEFCFTALQLIFGHFERRQLPLPHCSWARLLGSLTVLLSAHSFTINWHLLFENRRKRENGCKNFFMTKSPLKNVTDVGIELEAACMPSGHASDRAAAPGLNKCI